MTQIFPSPIICLTGNFTAPVSAGSNVITEPGKNVTFRCGTDSVIAMKRVTWERVHEGTVDTIVKCTQLNQSIHGSDYEERVEINCATKADTVVLWDVTTSDTGMFRCCYVGASGESGTHWTKLIVNGKWVKVLVSGKYLFQIHLKSLC